MHVHTVVNAVLIIVITLGCAIAGPNELPDTVRYPRQIRVPKLSSIPATDVVPGFHAVYFYATPRGAKNPRAYLDVEDTREKRLQRCPVSRDVPRVTVRYPELWPRKLVPLVGTLYETKSPAWFIRVKQDAYPKRIAIDKESVCLPLNGEGKENGFTKLDCWTVYVRSIEQPENAEGTPVAEIELEWLVPGKVANHWDYRRKRFQIEVDEKLKIDQDEWLVRRIVPANPDTRIIGWVEMARVPSKQPE